VEKCRSAFEKDGHQKDTNNIQNIHELKYKTTVLFGCTAIVLQDQWRLPRPSKILTRIPLEVLPHRRTRIVTNLLASSYTFITYCSRQIKTLDCETPYRAHCQMYKHVAITSE
jgi:hypothetical protein